MKPAYILLLILFLFSISCQQTLNNANELVEKQDSSYVKKAYFEKSGTLKSEISVKNKMKNGPAKEYYATGELRTLVNYENNIKVGETIWYYQNGKPYRVTPYVNGMMDGIRKIYYENGKLQAEIPYKNDELIEGTIEYDVNGKKLDSKVKIVFKTQDLLKYSNEFILDISLSNNFKNVKFFNEILSTSNKKIRILIDTKKGTGKIVYNLPPGSFEMRILKIYAEYNTSLGNPKLISSSYNLAIDHR